MAITAAVVGGLNVPQAVGDESLRRISAEGRMPGAAQPAADGLTARSTDVYPSPADRQRAMAAVRTFEARRLEALRASRAKAREAAAEKAKREAREAAERKVAAEKARLARMWTSPVADYRRSASFGEASGLWSSRHTGQDFAAPYGTAVRAVGSGVVTQSGWAGAYGNRVIVRHSDGTETWYCHLAATVVGGGKVSPGQVIGRVGSTGNSTGNHLHFEVRPGGEAGAPIDPVAWLRARGVRV